MAICKSCHYRKFIVSANSLYSTSSESLEAFRLKQALPNSDLKAPIKRSLYFTCSNRARQGTNTLHPHSSPWFDTQPTDPQQPSQRQPVQLNITPTYPSRNLWNFKPWLESTENPPTLLPSIPTSSKMAFGEANPVNSNSDSTMFEAFGNRNQQHLEAYILRTTIEPSKEFSVTWSYKIELLHLDDDAMQAHTRNLGPAYSIITAIGELSPEQLRQVQEHTKARDGHLVSVQFGAAADVVTSMGTFKVKPVVFVIKTAAAPVTGADSKVVVTEPSAQKFFFPAAGTPVHAPAQASSSLFGANALSGALFGNNMNPSVPPSFKRNHSWISSSEPWFHQEKLEDNRFETSHFMSITWAYGSTKSFEEIRLDDIKAGRVPEQAPLLVEEFLNEAPVPKPFLAATKPDVTTIKPAAQSETFQFGATTFKPQPAITASSINPKINTNTPGIFGAPRQDKGEFSVSRKFGQGPPKSQPGGLFGQAPRSVSDTSDLDSTYALPAKAAGSAALTRHSSVFKPATLILPKKGGSEFNIVANSYQGKAEERKIPFPVCRKCTKHFTAISANEQCVGLCPACAIEETTLAETACWLCDTKVPSGIADFSAAVVPNGTTEKEKAPAKPSTPTTSIKPETAAERKLKAKVEDFNPDEESEEMWSTRYDLLQTCQIE
jgi:hypothetical protein